MASGGRREAGEGKRIGRPPLRPVVDLSASKAISERVLPQIDEEKMWLEFLHVGKELSALNPSERAERRWALEQMTNRHYGKPAQQIIAGGTLRIEVVELGSDHPTAQTGTAQKVM